MCALALLVFAADFGNCAAVRLDYALDNRKSQTHALGFFGIKRLKHARPIQLGQARPVVDEIDAHDWRGELRARQVRDRFGIGQRAFHRQLAALRLKVDRVLD